MPDDPTLEPGEEGMDIRELVESWRPEGVRMKKTQRLIIEIDSNMADRCSYTFLEPIENLVEMKIGELLEEGTPLEEEGIALGYIRVRRSLGFFAWIRFQFSRLFSRPVYIPKEEDMFPTVVTDERKVTDGQTGTETDNAPSEDDGQAVGVGQGEGSEGSDSKA